MVKVVLVASVPHLVNVFDQPLHADVGHAILLVVLDVDTAWVRGRVVLRTIPANLPATPATHGERGGAPAVRHRHRHTGRRLAAGRRCTQHTGGGWVAIEYIEFLHKF